MSTEVPLCYPFVLSRYLAWITVIQRKWKFFKVFVYYPGVWDVSLCLHQSLFIVMMIIITGDMITVVTCFLPWRWICSEQKSRIFLWDQATRPAWPGSVQSLPELSSTTGRKHQQRHRGTGCSQPSSVSLPSQGSGWICGNFLKNRLTGDSLPLMSNVKLGKSGE